MQKRKTLIMTILNDHQPLHIETYNCNLESSINFKYIKKHMEDKKGIYLYQEVNPETLTKTIWKPNTFPYFKKNTSFGSSSLFMTYLASFRSIPSANVNQNVIVKKNFGDNELVFTNSLNYIGWTSHFEFVRHSIPKYIKDDFNNIDFKKRIGCRTTPWIILSDKNKKETYAVISVHGNGGEFNFKRIRLLRSLCEDAKKFSDKGYNVIIGGDFNMEPGELHMTLNTNGSITKNNFKPSLDPVKFKDKFPCNDTLRYAIDTTLDKFPITHINSDDGKEFAIDWILVSKNMKVTDVDVDKNIGNSQNPSDHAQVKIIVS